MKKAIVLLFSLSLLVSVYANKSLLEMKSPDKTITLNISTENGILWTVNKEELMLIKPSKISLQLQNGEVLGANPKVISKEIKETKTSFDAVNYRKSKVHDHYNRLLVKFKGNYALEFRVYNDAVAYRFLTSRKGEMLIKTEEANFNFTANHDAFVPYVHDYRSTEKFNASFESQYTEQKLSEFATDSLAMLPLYVNLGKVKAVLLEADLEDYPGMFLNLNHTKMGFKGVFAPYPLEVEVGGYNNMNVLPSKRADYIANVKGSRTFPWRIVAIANNDTELLNNDIVQKLAAPSRIENTSWIQPGLVAWDWWDNYVLSGVDFKAGMNTETFKHYIDFAAKNNAKYIILDEGWSNNYNLNEINENVDLNSIVNYGNEKGVRVILWSLWSTLKDQMHEVFPKYEKMGIAGWKIDFIDRDDQVAVASTYEIAKLAAEHKFLVDYHGIFKPTGLQRTYPNVVGYEGVYGLENFKWADFDAQRYVVTIPFTRNMAGPMDYTSGALRNVTNADFFPRNHAPLAKGTRCNQIAQFVVFEVPLQMFSDSPSEYYKEQETTDFIAQIPTVFDETVALHGKIGEYVAVARKRDKTWYVGAMTNQPMQMEIDFSFLDEGKYEITFFKDGVNADTQATDYKKEVQTITKEQKLNINMVHGGGWAARIEKK